MTNRVTEAQLKAIVDRINTMTGSPLKPYDDLTEGSMGSRYQIGNYHLSHAYGGVCLHRVSNTSGGVSDVLRCGHIPKRELADRMYAFINGFDAAQ